MQPAFGWSWPATALAALLFCAAGTSRAQSSVAVYSPQSTMISGERVQLQATALDAAGRALPNNNFTWASNRPDFVAVDAKGLATASGLGVADITVSLGNLRAVVRVPSLPLAVKVTPERVTLQIGESRQFSAIALDVNSQPIPGIRFEWAIDGDNGGLSVVASIDQNGLFTAAGVANFTVRAIVSYTSYPGSFVTRLFGAAYVEIPPIHDYKITRLVTTDSVRDGLHLRQRRNTIVGNDKGQLAMTASLDGLTSGLVQYDGARLNLLLSGGAAGVVQGGPVWDFLDPAINARGDILTRADEIGAGSSLVLWQDGQLFTVHLDGQVIQADQVQSNQDQIARYSLNDNGEFVFRAFWRPTAASPQVTGLYRSVNGRLIVDRVPTDPLPGLTSPVVFGTEMGIDNAGYVWFTATDGTNTGIFRDDLTGSAIRILITGDTLAGARVTSISQLGVNAASGEIMVTGNTNNGSFVARYAGGAAASAAPAAVVGSGFSLLSFNNGGPVLSGYGDSGNGLYTFSGGKLRKLLLYGALAPSGEPIVGFQSAILLAGGDLIANVSTPSLPITVVRLGTRNSTLFSLGSRVDGVVNLAVRDLIPGAKSGPAHVTMGGGHASIFSADLNGPAPALVTGDSLPGGWPFFGSYNVRKGPNGELYVTIDQALYRLAGGKPTLLARFGNPCETGVTCSAPQIVAVNDGGQLAAILNSNAGTRIGILNGSTFRIILRTGDTLPGAGRITSFNTNEFAIDAGGRVMAFVNGAAGSGYFVYSGTAWSPAAVINSTDLGPALTSVSGLRAAGRQFYALLSFANGNFFIGSWDGQWTPLVSRNAPAPTGNNVSGISAFDVNRNGDVAYVANLNGSTAVMVQTGDRTRMVFLGTEPMQPDWWVRTLNALDLRDDRSLYFMCWSLADQYGLFYAEPIN